MATTISSLQQDLLTDPLSVRLLNYLISEQTQNSKILKDDSRILHSIYMASAEVKAALLAVYGTSDLETIPYAMPAIIPKANDYGSVTENTGNVSLYGVQPSTSAKTETFRITFTDVTDFSVVGSRSGSDGSGDINTDFTSDSTWLIIPSDTWTGTPAANDYIDVAVWHVHSMVGYVTTLIAAALCHFSLFNSVVPNESSLGKLYRDEANRILKNLVRGFDEEGTPFRLPSFSTQDFSEIANPWHISARGGEDLSNYSDSETPERINNDIGSWNTPWWY